MARPPRRNCSTSASLPGFASRRTSRATFTISASLRIALPDCSVLLEQLLLPRIVWDLAAFDEYVLGAGRELERIAGPHHDIRILAGFERPEALGDPPDPRRYACHGA